MNSSFSVHYQQKCNIEKTCLLEGLQMLKKSSAVCSKWLLSLCMLLVRTWRSGWSCFCRGCYVTLLSLTSDRGVCSIFSLSDGIVRMRLVWSSFFSKTTKTFGFRSRYHKLQDWCNYTKEISLQVPDRHVFCQWILNFSVVSRQV